VAETRASDALPGEGGRLDSLTDRLTRLDLATAMRIDANAS
jgi:hypothetical protein